jgi:hypothetical protein
MRCGQPWQPSPAQCCFCASSPYAKRGALHAAYVRHYAKDGDPVLVWKAPTRTLNPTVAQSTVDEAIAQDASHGEYLAEFRGDLESFISREAVMACVDPGVLERPPSDGVQYFSFVDPSGGNVDSMTLAIAHESDERVAVDALYERTAPFDPESCVDEFVQLMSRYGISETNGDRFGAAWVTTAFEKRNIAYRPCELPRTEHLPFPAPVAVCLLGIRQNP